MQKVNASVLFTIYKKMKNFLDEQFLLNTKTAQALYHDYAADMPIIDYHCHLPPQQIAENTKFDNITQVWLNGDHYKWRAMRTNGVDESYITGDKPDREKFRKWAETVPYTLRNPLYHWAHLELKRYFGISELLGPDTADRIFDNITQVWLNGDHYKWRAMRTNGVDESYITGDKPDREKFRKWAETVPYTLRNPLYHWAHLELKRYFGISELLGPDTADRIFD